jgi:flagellar hook protein FlgE
VVRDPSSGATEYTRAGNFQVDANGNLVTATGEKVQGWTQTNGVLDTNGSISDIVIPAGTLRAPAATANTSIDVNLDASATVGAASGSFSTPVQVVDSLGNTHVLTFTFTKTAANTWTYAASIPGDDVKTGTAGTPFPIASAAGTLTFGADGILTDPAAAKGVVPIKVAGMTDGAADLNINWSLYNPDLTARVTQFASPTAVSTESQDGVAAAQLTHVSLSSGGEILAQFSNGQQVAVAQLALATIRNPESLTAVGNNNFQLSAETATPAVGTANTGGRGNVLSGALESSTVDIAHEFTNLIVFQRGYEAAARVITTTDQLTQDTINLKQQ